MEGVGKHFLTLLLVAIIAASSAYIGVRAVLGYDPTGQTSISLRTKLVQVATLRDIFNLHDTGDGKTDYLSASTQHIAIQVYTMPSENVDDAVFETLASKIQDVTGKVTALNTTYGSLSDLVTTTPATRDTLLSPYDMPHSMMPSTATLNVFILSADSEAPNELGLTYRENGIILFEHTLEASTKRSPQTLEAYQLSTLLHEFGHQMGLDHNTEPGCLMNASADITDSLNADSNNIVTNFCTDEMAQVKQLKDETRQ